MQLLTDQEGRTENCFDHGHEIGTAQLDMEDLAEVTETDVIDATPDPNDLVYDLVFRDQVPLGINLLLNDESGMVRVVDFPR